MQTKQRGADGFVTKLNSTGTALVYSTYLGGSANDGATFSSNFPTAGAFRSTLSDPKSRDPFIAKLEMTGGAPPAEILPRISRATVSGKKLLVQGERFKPGALILLGGEEQKTANDTQSPSTLLIAKKAGKKVKPGNQVMIQVKNPDGAISERYLFIR